MSYSQQRNLWERVLKKNKIFLPSPFLFKVQLIIFYPTLIPVLLSNLPGSERPLSPALEFRSRFQ